MEEKTVAESLEEMRRAVDTDVRICRRIEVGTVLHQGDVYVHCVAPDHPRGERRGVDGESWRQVAVGEGEGSRHVAEGRLTVYEGAALPPWVTFSDSALDAAALGPLVVAHEQWSLTHPSHPHHVVPAGVYQVTYQIDMRTRRAVDD